MKRDTLYYVEVLVLVPTISAFSPYDFSNPVSLQDFVQTIKVPDFNQLHLVDDAQKFVQSVQVPYLNQLPADDVRTGLTFPDIKTFGKLVNDAFLQDTPPKVGLSPEYLFREFSLVYLGLGISQGVKLKNPVTAPFALFGKATRYIFQPEDNFEIAGRMTQTAATATFIVGIILGGADGGVALALGYLEFYGPNLDKALESGKKKFEQNLLSDNASQLDKNSSSELILVSDAGLTNNTDTGLTNNTRSFFSKIFDKAGSIGSNISEAITTSLKSKLKNFVELIDINNIDTDLNGNKSISFEEACRLRDIGLIAMKDYLFDGYVWDQAHPNNSSVGEIQNKFFDLIAECSTTLEVETSHNLPGSTFNLQQLLTVNDCLNLLIMKGYLNDTINAPINISDSNLGIDHNASVFGLDTTMNSPSIAPPLGFDASCTFNNSIDTLGLLGN